MRNSPASFERRSSPRSLLDPSPQRAPARPAKVLILDRSGNQMRFSCYCTTLNKQSQTGTEAHRTTNEIDLTPYMSHESPSTITCGENATACDRAVRRQPSQNGGDRNDVISCGEERGKDQAWRVRRKAERSLLEVPADRRAPAPSGEERRHRETQPCDAVTTGRGRCQSARGHRGQPQPTHGAHPGQRQTEQWRAIIGQGLPPQCPEESGADVVWKSAESLRAS